MEPQNPVAATPANTATNPPMPKVENQPVPQGGTTAGAQEYARVFTRFVASLVDGVLIMIVIGVLSIPLSVSLEEPSAILQIIYMVISSLYFIILTARSGQTLGKKLLKIKVVKLETSTPPSYMSAFLREVVGKWVSSLVLFLGYFWAIWDKQKQTWHDKIAGTVVVKV